MASRERLIVVNTSRSWGGNEYWAVQVAAGLGRRGHAVTFVWSHDVVGDRIGAASLSGRRLRLRNDGDVAGLLALAAQMHRGHTSTVLLTKWREYLLGGLAARVGRGPRPRVVTSISLAQTPRRDLKRRLVVDLADRILVNACEVRDSLLASGWIDARKIDVVVNGLDLDAHQPRWQPEMAAAGGALRASLGISAQAPLLVNIANLTPQKDQATLLRAVARLRARWPALRVLILGDGMLRGELTALCAHLGLQDCVLMPGFATDVWPAFAAGDLFVLSSNNEGMAWVLIEAAAAGLPAVTTAVSGARECVHDGVTGRVVVPEDDVALAGAVDELLADPARRERMGQVARRLAEAQFTEARMLDQVEAVLFG